MKRISYFFLLVFLISCTSNTILEKPKDLIPKDTMSLLIQEMMVASSAKFTKNKYKQKNINYMPFVYDKFKIDSTRFQSSNLYYMSKIDDYIKIFDDAKTSLENKKTVIEKLQKIKDSIKKDSIKKQEIKVPKKKDSLKVTPSL